MAAGTENISAATLSSLFSRAADCLSASQPDPPPDDVGALWRTLEYESDPGGPEVVANRVALLRAAARFSRVFQMSAPEAPGLVFLGGGQGGKHGKRGPLPAHRLSMSGPSGFACASAICREAPKHNKKADRLHSSASVIQSPIFSRVRPP